MPAVSLISAITMRCSLSRRNSPCRIPRGKRPSSISLLTKATPRSSDSSDALKLISFTRLMISRVRVGTLRRSRGLICTISTSSVAVARRNGMTAGIAAVAAVPVGHAVDLHRAEQVRQRGRGHDHLGRDFRAREDAQLSGVDIGGGDEQLGREVAADRVEIDEAVDQVLERVDVERVEVVGREHARHRAEPQAVACERKEPLDHAALQVRQVAVDAHRPPEVGEPRPRLVRPAAGETVGEHDSVDCARRGAGNAFDLDAAVLEQLVEHAPGEGAVGAAALQRKVNALAPLLEAPRPMRPRRRGLRRRQRP